MLKSIKVVGARTHNLKNVDVEIPLGKFTVVTGPSGSGKSSLAIDTVFAEGQRQYVESLSISARQYFDQIVRPPVRQVTGLPPMLAIDQKRGFPNRRSTVGTQTEIHDHLRILFARVGDVKCFQCGSAIKQLPLEKIRTEILRLPERSKVMILAPMVRGRQGQHPSVFQEIRKSGLLRVRVNGVTTDIENLPELDPHKKNSIEAITDRIIIRDDIDSRLMEALETAVQLSGGLATAAFMTPENREQDLWEERIFNSLHGCPDCSISYAEIEPRTFSFNSPYGACPDCDGMGAFEQFDPDLVIPDKQYSLKQAGVKPWTPFTRAQRERHWKLLQSTLEQIDFSLDTPLSRLSSEPFQQLWQGFGKKSPGIRDLLEKEFATTQSDHRLDELQCFRRTVECSSCLGTRLGTAGNAVFISGKTIAQFSAMNLRDLHETLSVLQFDEENQQVADALIEEIQTRLKYMLDVGLGYLTLDRLSNSLSGGELQRTRLSAAIGTTLTGVCYVLDEPSIGLHQRDNQQLIATLRELQTQGNTLVVVEHDQEMMLACDWLIDVGPGAGTQGGEIVFSCAPDQLSQLNSITSRSLTAQYLNGDRTTSRPTDIRPSDHKTLLLQGAHANNLQDVDLKLPLERLVTITGVSGSGKSSLVREALYPAMARHLGLSVNHAQNYRSISGHESIEKIIWVDQKPIGRSPRSCLATYCGMFAEIRKIFAQTKLAKSKGFSHSRFSFNNAAGKCGACDGNGVVKMDINFLSDLFVPCTSCKGKRFNRETLTVKFKGQTIADVLAMKVEEAFSFFESIPKIHTYLDRFMKIGLGYLSLGQSSTTLSGGEAQRIKLATELAKAQPVNTLYLLDEPTTGLHFEDVQRLINVLDALVEQGNSVVVIEHNLDLIQCSDWVIDLGPDGGKEGGQVIAAGTPEEISQVEKSWTGKCLKPILATRSVPQ